jgi:hypothetical protein
MPTVQVSEHVKDELENLKEGKDHTSYDSAIRELLMVYESVERTDA